MKRAIGIGGIFFKSEKPDELRDWYKQHLGINIEQFGGAVFSWQKLAEDNPAAYTVWSPFDATTDYMNPSKSEFMVNFVVDDLDALLAALKDEGVELVGDPMNDENFGKFGWVMDPEGRKVELWEPPKNNLIKMRHFCLVIFSLIILHQANAHQDIIVDSSFTFWVIGNDTTKGTFNQLSIENGDFEFYRREFYHKKQTGIVRFINNQPTPIRLVSSRDHLLIQGSFLNGQRTGIWIFDSADTPNNVGAVSFSLKHIIYSPDSIIVENYGFFSLIERYWYNSDSTTIEGEIAHFGLDWEIEEISFRCSRSDGLCQFWTAELKDLFPAIPYEEFETIKMIINTCHSQREIAESLKQYLQFLNE